MVRAGLTGLMVVSMAWPVAGWASSGEIAAVVVYPDRAVVTRALPAPLAAGVNEVRFDDLPPSLDPATLQASGDGVAGARIVAIEVRDRELAEDRRARVAELERSIFGTRDAITAANDAVVAAGVEAKFLGQIEAASAKQLSAELLFSDQAVKQSDGIAALLRARLPEAQAARRTAEIEVRDLKATLGALERELAEVRGAAQWSRRDVVVSIHAPAAGSGTVALTYALPGASWQPVYDVYGTPSAPSLTVTLSAMVHQTTGEDWSGVALSLSTARPARGLAPPPLDPFWIQPPQPVYARAAKERASYVVDGFGLDDDDGASFYVEEEAVIDAPMPADLPPPMVVQQASVASSGAVVRFDVPGASFVPGDGARRKLLVSSVEQPVAWQHEVVSRQAQAAFVVATGDWGGAWPLLPGAASVFSSGAFVGTAQIPSVGPGGELRVGFGQDESVVVKLTTVTHEDGVADWLGRALLTRRYRTTVSNGGDAPVQLVLRDVLPRATDARLRIKPLGDSPSERTTDGLLAWSRELPASGSAAVEHGFTIRHPKNARPGSLP